MDATSCPLGYVTDVSFDYPTPDGFCATNLTVYITLVTIVFVVRLAALVKQWFNWSEANSRQKRKGRLPFAPALSTFALILASLLFILIGVNVINVHNGGAWALYSFSFLPYCIATSFLLFRTVRLGSKIIPLGKDIGENSLKTFSVPGRALATMQLMSIMISSFGLIILGPIFIEWHVVIGSVGIALKGLYITTLCSGLIVQFQRCILVIKKIQRNTNDMISSGYEVKEKTDRAIKAMRQRQVICFIAIVTLSMQYYLLAARAIPWTFFLVFLLPAGLETSISFVVEFFIMNPKRARKNGQIAFGDNLKLPTNTTNTEERNKLANAVEPSGALILPKSDIVSSQLIAHQEHQVISASPSVVAE